MFDMKIMLESMELGGRFNVEHWRDGKQLSIQDIHNEITTEGKDALLDIMFHNDTQIEQWWLGLVDVAGFTATAIGDTYAQIDGLNGWDEFTDYAYSANSTSRAEWQEDASSNGVISNTTVAVFDIDAAGSVYGLHLVGGGTTPSLQADSANGGTLWATANFTANVVVANTDQLKVTYTITA